MLSIQLLILKIVCFTAIISAEPAAADSKLPKVTLNAKETKEINKAWRTYNSILYTESGVASIFSAVDAAVPTSDFTSKFPGLQTWVNNPSYIVDFPISDLKPSLRSAYLSIISSAQLEDLEIAYYIATGGTFNYKPQKTATGAASLKSQASAIFSGISLNATTHHAKKTSSSTTHTAKHTNGGGGGQPPNSGGGPGLFGANPTTFSATKTLYVVKTTGMKSTPPSSTSTAIAGIATANREVMFAGVAVGAIGLAAALL